MDEERIETEVREHLLVRGAMEYMKLAGEWFHAAEDIDGDLRVADLGDSGGVIMYYRTLIPAKIQRAVRHPFEGESSSMPDLSHEGDGSAKVALIAMDRSIAA